MCAKMNKEKTHTGWSVKDHKMTWHKLAQKKKNAAWVAW